MDTRAARIIHLCQLSYVSFDDINHRVQKPSEYNKRQWADKAELVH